MPPPKPKRVEDGFLWRYQEQSIEQALIQKLARYISGLSAAHVLLTNGFVQEQGVLERTLDELNEDIIFLAGAILTANITALHQKYLKAFYAEEFLTISDPVGSLNERYMTPRKKIRAYISRTIGPGSDPSHHLAVLKTISKVYSGFVHAASPQIMDMCAGDPPIFHVSGMLGTPRIDESSYDIWNYFYRGLISVMFVGKAFGDSSLVDALLKYSFDFQEASRRDFGARRPET